MKSLFMRLALRMSPRLMTLEINQMIKIDCETKIMIKVGIEHIKLTVKITLIQ